MAIVDRFYVYMYLDLDNVPFYIGKGKDNRYKASKHLHKCRSNPFLKNKIRKVGVANIRIHFLHRNISEEEAFHWERYWIKYIGRRNLEAGTLCNLTDGGEGDSGRIVSEETRQKISKMKKGKMTGKKNPRYGKPGYWTGKERSEETKQKISEGLEGHTTSEETKQQISETLMSHKVSNGTRQKISRTLTERRNVNKGRKRETRND
ncbi:hypothetical protein LCGC14_1150820 [marine sediment metagenome]|uniref:GIY-YIG domain-containing protein n=1 Tax=marine sediment metagenome TaxID=412755 RepID=A0A0F9MIS8_9ZZZZ